MLIPSTRSLTRWYPLEPTDTAAGMTCKTYGPIKSFDPAFIGRDQVQEAPELPVSSTDCCKVPHRLALPATKILSGADSSGK